jgi:hypothetical protein
MDNNIKIPTNPDHPLMPKPPRNNKALKASKQRERIIITKE